MRARHRKSRITFKRAVRTIRARTPLKSDTPAKGLTIKDVITIAISLVALSLSLWSTYFAVRTVDHISALYTDNFDHGIVSDEDKKFTGRFSSVLTLINSGTTSAAVVRSRIYAVFRSDAAKSCTGDQQYSADLLPASILKDGDVLPVRIEKEIEFIVSSNFYGRDFNSDVCLEFWLVTPHREVILRRRITQGGHKMDHKGVYSNTKSDPAPNDIYLVPFKTTPITVIKEASTILTN